MRRLSKEKCQEADLIEGYHGVRKLKLSESIGLLFIIHGVMLVQAVLVYLTEDYVKVVRILVYLGCKSKGFLIKLWSKIKFIST